MIDNIRKSNGRWETALPLLSELEEIIKQGQALAYSSENIAGVFEDKFPGYKPHEGLWAQRSKLWTDTQLNTLRNILQGVAKQNEDFQQEQPFVEGILNESNRSVGRMQVMQHGNALVAANIKQLVKLRQLLMSQINTNTVYRAAEISRRAESEAKGVSWASRAPRTLAPMSPNDPRGIGDFEFINPKRRR